MMRHSHISHAYPASHYDDHLCLKPPLLLWVAALYLSRAVTLPIAMAIAHFAGVDQKAITLTRALWSVDGLVPSLIAAAVLYALIRRVPTASAPVRWLWAHGRTFLAIASIMDTVLIATALVRQGVINDQSLWSVGAALGDLYFLVYVLAARRVRHALSEFPAAL
jgi:hypothetical protein